MTHSCDCCDFADELQEEISLYLQALDMDEDELSADAEDIVTTALWTQLIHGQDASLLISQELDHIRCDPAE